MGSPLVISADPSKVTSKASTNSPPLRGQALAISMHARVFPAPRPALTSPNTALRRIRRSLPQCETSTWLQGCGQFAAVPNPANKNKGI